MSGDGYGPTVKPFTLVANGLTATTMKRYYGASVRATAAGLVANLRDGTVGGQIIEPISLGPNESFPYEHDGQILLGAGLYTQVVSGAIDAGVAEGTSE